MSGVIKKIRKSGIKWFFWRIKKEVSSPSSPFIMKTMNSYLNIKKKFFLIKGNKREDKTYYRHTGYPGGIKSRTAGEILEGKKPEDVVIKAVLRMLPKNRLARNQLSNLRVYAGAEHPHEAQNPEALDIASMNPKNKRRA